VAANVHIQINRPVIQDDDDDDDDDDDALLLNCGGLM
jgi:hypothetical protein